MERPAWYPDELVSAGEEHLDPAYVAGYDRKSAVDPSGDVEMLLRSGLGREDVVVDLGGGTGVFAEAIAPHCARVVVVDVSPAMLAALESRMEQQGIANIDIVRAGFLSYDHQGEPARAVYSRNALHHLPDFWKAVALTRVADMLAPGGTFLMHDLVYDFDPRDASAVFEDWFSRAQARPEDGWTQPELEEHVRQEYSTFSWLMEPMLERAGFEILESNPRQSKTYGAYLCRKR